MKQHDALLIVDPQNDFFPSGTLPVPEGDKIIPELNKWILQAQKAHVPILVSRDWHPENHCSFKNQGGVWPVHCVKNTHGADFHKELIIPSDAIVIDKAFTIDKDAFSAFEGQLKTGESLESYLNNRNIQRLWIGGLALDYCVKATVLSAISAGFEVYLILAATRAISEDTEKESLEMMRKKGVHFV